MRELTSRRKPQGLWNSENDMPTLKPNTCPVFLPLPSSPLVQSAREKRRQEIRDNVKALLKLLALSALAGWMLAIR